MNDTELRTKNFKIGTLHGKNLTERFDEPKLRNDLFLKGEIYLDISRKEKKKIRLLAYEMPLKDPSSGECIDLFGIDKNWCPYIIELKLKEGEGLDVAIEELERYHGYFEQIKEHVANEIKDAYFLRNFKFRNKTQKIVVANREYFRQEIRRRPNINVPDDIEYFYFTRRGETPIEERILKYPDQQIHLHIFRA
jgi:hypothetical protein